MIIDEPTVISAEWHVYKRFADGTTETVARKHNLLTNLCKQSLLYSLLAPLSGDVIAGFPYIGFGSGSTAAIETDTALTTELTGNANRIAVTDSTGASFSTGDVVLDSSVSPYTVSTVVQVILPAIDGNNGSTVYEMGLFTAATFATGTMANHIVLGSPGIPKTSLFALVCDITFRI